MLELSSNVADAATGGAKEDLTMVQIDDSNNEPVLAAQTGSLNK